MSKAFYLGSFIGSALLLFLLVFMVGATVFSSTDIENLKANAIASIVLTLIICFAVVVYLFVVTAVMFYKMWDAVRDEGTPVSPVLAVVLLLIPIANIVWAFLVYPLYVKYYNEYIVRRSAGVEALRPGLFYVYPVLLGINLVCSAIAQVGQLFPRSTMLLALLMPFSIFGMIASIASFVVFLILIVKICDAVNALPVTTGDGGGGAARRG